MRILATVLILLIPVAAVPAQGELKGADKSKLVASVREYFSNLDDDLPGKADKTRQKLQASIDKFGKAIKVDDLLADVEVWRELIAEGSIPKKTRLKIPAKGKFRPLDIEADEDRILRLSGASDLKDKTIAKVFNGQLEALVSIPSDYAKKNYPVVLVLHDLQDESAKKLAELESSRNMKDRLTKWAEETYTEELRKNAIILIPVMDLIKVDSSGLSGMRPRWESPEGKEWALTVLSQVVFMSCQFDSARLFIDGHGEAGSAAAMQFCAQHPSLQTGAIVRGAGAKKLPEFTNCSNMPMKFVGDEAKVWVDEWKGKDGFERISHADSLDAAALALWMADNPKTYCPPKVEVKTDSLAFGTAYWVKIDDLDFTNEKLSAEISVKIGENNEIHVNTSEKVKAFTLFLNDTIVNLDEEIKVICKHAGAEQGEVRFQGTKKRSLEDLLNFSYGQIAGNTGEVFVAAVYVEVGGA